MPSSGTSSTEPQMFCLRCDYNLHGLTEHRCPECVQPFDPNDRWTFNPSVPAPISWQTILAYLGIASCFFIPIPRAGPVQPSLLADLLIYLPHILLLAFGFAVSLSGVRTGRAVNRSACAVALGIYSFAIVLFALACPYLI